jgi:hypothetical protein
MYFQQDNAHQLVSDWTECQLIVQREVVAVQVGVASEGGG